jgi:GNAT superfamily N-acetyltransferase
MSRTSIRTAEPGDAAALARLSGELGYTVEVATAAERLAGLARLAGHAVLVAEAAGGEVVGWVHVFAARRLESPAFAELGGLVVAEELRGRGVGWALVAAAEAWAGERGLAELRVRSNVVRDDAHRFYRRLGFAESKRQAVFRKPLRRPPE